MERETDKKGILVISNLGCTLEQGHLSLTSMKQDQVDSVELVFGRKGTSSASLLVGEICHLGPLEG